MQNRDIFSIFFKMEVCFVFSLESSHRDDSNEYTQYTIFNIKKKIVLNLPLWVFSKGLKNEPPAIEPLKVLCISVSTCHPLYMLFHSYPLIKMLVLKAELV